MKVSAVLYILVSSILSSALLVTQAPSDGAQMPLPPTKAIVALIKKAEAADTQEGLEEYSKYLTKMVVPNDVGDAYTGALSDRLAKAELATRQGKRKFIPDGSVAEAFNELMKKAGNSSAPPISTTTLVVHRLRISVRNTSPVLSTLDSHSSECLPSEAAFLIYLLLANDGAFTLPGPTPRGVSLGTGARSARGNLAVYAASHSQTHVVEMYDQVFQRMGI